ncbi:hypothetical protein [Bradyrhizobium japonicum]|uniref:hypothetical protein n=2 Tax=Bradyrhizobium japonicum TaxID=375 RepID=UPI00200C1BDE|nr:hypothetical protein [Bradyrhizobium japonicum]UQE03344.1 hypothetical protein JEY30_48420 [Bradyrhizobium japonicum]
MNAGECVRRLFFVIFAPDSQQESSPLSGRKSTQATVRICGASSVILVDRPVIDALGYLHAALQVSARTIDSRRSGELMTIVKAHIPDYDILIRTAVDTDIAVGEGRDSDAAFRVEAASSIERLVNQIEPKALILTSGNRDKIVERVLESVRSRLLTLRPQ